MSSIEAVVTGITIYPIKGFRGVALECSAVEPRGLSLDRRWVVVDRDGSFLSQRSTAEMATCTVEVLDDGLVISRDGFGRQHVPYEPNGDPLLATVWGSTVASRTVSAEVDIWLSHALGSPCRLAVMTPESDRPVNPAYGRPGDQVSFADAFPILLANTASLDDLNRRMETPVPMNRFRANIIVSGAPPWAEDSFKQVQVGQHQFRAVKMCGRCLVTTTDQETGVRGTEPLATMATFRKFDQTVNFGMYLVPDEPGVIHVGDGVTAW